MLLDLKELLRNVSPELVKTSLALLSAWLLNRLTTKSADLISYMSQLQTVAIPAQGQVPAANLSTFSLFLWNQGKATAKDVQILHVNLPPHSVYPDLPRSEIQTPGGGTTIHLPSIPPKVLVTVTYFVVSPPGGPPVSLPPIISQVNYEQGPAHFIPVNLQRVWSKPMQFFFAILLFAGIYTLIGWVFELVMFLRHRA